MSVLLRAAFACVLVAAVSASCSLIYSTSGFDAREASTGDAGDARPEAPVGCDAGVPDPRYLNDAVEISLGGLYSCALRRDGSVVCWGDDRFLQLGSPRAEKFSAIPIALDFEAPAVHLSAGERHACVATSDGGAYCWGDNRYGEVGSGSDAEASAPMKVVAAANDQPASGITQVASGFGHSCAIIRGAVACWGNDTWDQTGTGGSTSRAEMSQVSTNPSPIAVATGWCQSCVLAGSEVKCWGSNQGCLSSSGSDASIIPTPAVLGVPGATQTETPQPFDIVSPGGGAVMQLVTGPFNTCAVDILGKVFCSGSNGFGEIGSILPPLVKSPKEVTDFVDSGPTQLALGPYHSCILTSATTVACVGSNTTGELGLGVSDPPDAAPRAIGLVVWGDGGPLTGASAVAAGGVSIYAGFVAAHSCAIVKPACATSGTVVCWGSNRSGQLGDGTRNDRPYPAPVLAPR